MGDHLGRDLRHQGHRSDRQRAPSVLPDADLPHPEAGPARSTSTARRPSSWRSHQVPLASARDTEAHFEVLKNWLESYKPEELFDANGAVKDDVLAFMPKGELRIGANPNANGGVIRNDLKLPNLETTRSRKWLSTATAGASSRPPVPWVPTLATSSRTTRATSASSDRMRPLPTVCRLPTKSPTSSGMPATSPTRSTSTCTSPARSLSSCPSTRWKASSRPTC